jgi:hypothetical protein
VPRFSMRVVGSQGDPNVEKYWSCHQALPCQVIADVDDAETGIGELSHGRSRATGAH